VLDDVLGSAHGLIDSTGMLSGTADYDVFGAVRQSSGSASIFGFTAEQRDSTTGFTYLRALYLDPTLGSFTQADSVQPHAPGTHGWNLYAYLANNPTTWADPSGRDIEGPISGSPSASDWTKAVNAAAWIVSLPFLIARMQDGAQWFAVGIAVVRAAPLIGGALMALGGLIIGGCGTAILIAAASILVCALDAECRLMMLAFVAAWKGKGPQGQHSPATTSVENSPSFPWPPPRPAPPYPARTAIVRSAP
jgi:RHS repeat-associated protein